MCAHDKRQYYRKEKPSAVCEYYTSVSDSVKLSSGQISNVVVLRKRKILCVQLGQTSHFGVTTMSSKTAASPDWNLIRATIPAVWTPEFLGQPWQLRAATVRSKTTVLGSTYLTVTFDTHEDSQSVSAVWRIPRKVLMPVSRRLFKAAYGGLSLPIFCQYSRHEQKGWSQPWSGNVRVKPAH